jgi:hypothetical protein
VRLVAWAATAATAVAAVPLIIKGRKTWQAYQTLRAIDIRTVNTVAADAERTAGVTAPAATLGNRGARSWCRRGWRRPYSSGRRAGGSVPHGSLGASSESL